MGCKHLPIQALEQLQLGALQYWEEEAPSGGLLAACQSKLILIQLLLLAVEILSHRSWRFLLHSVKLEQP